MYKVALFVALAIGAGWFCKKQTDGFAVSKIISSFSSNWEPPAADLEPILNQKFTYLGKGVQCFAFASEDGNTVIKFFRHDHLKKEAKLKKDFASYQLAFEKLKDQTGLIYLHFGNRLNQTLQIVDKLGICHTIPLANTQFVIQQRAELVYPTLKKLIDQGNMVAAKAKIDVLVGLLQARLEAGLSDKNPDLETNFGFTGKQAIQIDVGRFSVRTSTEPHRDEITRITDKFKKWLPPELALHLEQKIDAIE